MSSKKLPALQFYVGDWRKDPGVQALDYEYRGVWFELLLLMHESEERGKLLLNGNPMPDEAVARLLGLDVQKWTKIKHTLLDYGVASIEQDTGAFYCRRMVEDEAKRQKKARAGRKGGKKSKPKQNPKQKGSKTEAEGEAKRGSSYSSSNSISSSDKPYTREFEDFWELYDVKKGKKRAWQKWKNLTKEDHENIMDNVPIFLTHFSSEQWTPRPRKYLTNEYWNDEGFQQPKQQNNDSSRKTKGDRRIEILRQQMSN